MDEEYIKNLTNEEKLIFFKLFCKMIRIDGHIAQEETDFLKHIGNFYGFAPNEIMSIIKSPEIDHTYEASKIKNRQNALYLIKALCTLANADKSLEEKELDLIIETARALGIEDEKIILINRLVLDSLILANVEQIIMEKI